MSVFKESIFINTFLPRALRLLSLAFGKKLESLSLRVGATAKVICRRETQGERITVEENRAHGNGPQLPNYTRYPFTAGWTGVYIGSPEKSPIDYSTPPGNRTQAFSVVSRACYPCTTEDLSLAFGDSHLAPP